MSDHGNSIDDMFVASFNADLQGMHCAATIALSQSAVHKDVFELLDDEGQFITFMPMSATPEVTAVAYRLYGQGLNTGIRAGEAAAWSKLRWLIGAAPAEHVA